MLFLGSFVFQADMSRSGYSQAVSKPCGSAGGGPENRRWSSDVKRVGVEAI